MGEVPQNFHGKVGASGRPSLVDEVKRARIVELALDFLEEEYIKKNKSDRDSVLFEASLKIFLKAMPTQVSGDNGEPLTLQIQKTEELLEKLAND